MKYCQTMSLDKSTTMVRMSLGKVSSNSNKAASLVDFRLEVVVEISTFTLDINLQDKNKNL